MTNTFSISKEFIDENKLGQTGPKKKGGPYSAAETHFRRNEVYRLHFDYGYSGRKISEMMNVNRKTIDNDLDIWYSKIIERWDYPDPEVWLLSNMENLEVQKTRIREEIDKTSDIQARISI